MAMVEAVIEIATMNMTIDCFLYFLSITPTKNIPNIPAKSPTAEYHIAVYSVSLPIKMNWTVVEIEVKRVMNIVVATETDGMIPY